MIEVTAYRASARESGKAIAYLDPALMANEGLCAGELVKIFFRHSRGKDEWIFRLGPELHELRNTRSVKIDRFYWHPEMLNGSTTVFVARLESELFLQSVLMYSSPYIPRDDHYRNPLESLIRSFRLPARKGYEYNFLVGNSSFHAKVMETQPLQGGIIGPQTEIVFGPESEELRSRWKPEVNKLKIADRIISLQRRIESLQDKGRKLIQERKALLKRVKKLKEENSKFSFEKHAKHKDELKHKVTYLLEQKERLREQVGSLKKLLVEHAKVLARQADRLKEISPDGWEKIMENVQYKDLWEKIYQDLRDTPEGEGNGKTES